MSIGYLPEAHHSRCAVYKVIAKKNPPWMKAMKK
jgi:hypothetical protein